MVFDFLLSLFLDSIRLVFQVHMVLAEILVETAFLQVELLNQQAAMYGREQYSVLYGAMENSGCIVGMFAPYELVKPVSDSVVLCCKWRIFNQFARMLLVRQSTDNLQETEYHLLGDAAEMLAHQFLC